MRNKIVNTLTRQFSLNMCGTLTNELVAYPDPVLDLLRGDDDAVDEGQQGGFVGRCLG